MRTIVLDTNVLLADPGSLFAFPDAEIVIPETVLGELDKLKTSRVDPDLRFRGREVSRMLFELSEQGSLLEGVELPDGGNLRVLPLDSDIEMPEGLSSRNADDRILAVAFQACRTGCEELTLVTNDLNMLLKAQSLGLNVHRHGDGIEGSFMRRYVIRPFQRYKIPLGILFMSLAVFAAVVVVLLWGGVGRNQTNQSTAGIPQEYRDLMSSVARVTPPNANATAMVDVLRQALDYLVTLQSKPDDPTALLGIANVYLDLRDSTGSLDYARRAIVYYDQYLAVQPDNTDARTDLAISLFYSGQTDRAIQEVGTVLEGDPSHLRANYNLGIFYRLGRGDTAGAISQFEKVLELAPEDDPHVADVRALSQQNLDELLGSAEGATQQAPQGGTQ